MDMTVTSNDTREGGPGLVARISAPGVPTVVLKTARAGDRLAVDALNAEAEVLWNADGRGMPAVLAEGTLEDGRPALLMEYIAGWSLSGLLGKKAVSVEQMTRIVGETLDVLERNEVVSADYSPRNVLVGTEGDTWVIDPGTGLFMSLHPEVRPGKPGYMAPELIEDGEIAVTGALDVYAAGVTLLTAVDGAVGRDRGRQAGAVARLPAMLRPLARGMLAHAPADRPSRREVVAAMRSLAGDVPLPRVSGAEPWPTVEDPLCLALRVTRRHPTRADWLIPPAIWAAESPTVLDVRRERGAAVRTTWAPPAPPPQPEEEVADAVLVEDDEELDLDEHVTAVQLVEDPTATALPSRRVAPVVRWGIVVGMVAVGTPVLAAVGWALGAVVADAPAEAQVTLPWRGTDLSTSPAPSPSPSLSVSPSPSGAPAPPAVPTPAPSLAPIPGAPPPTPTPPPAPRKRQQAVAPPTSPLDASRSSVPSPASSPPDPPPAILVGCASAGWTCVPASEDTRPNCWWEGGYLRARPAASFTLLDADGEERITVVNASPEAIDARCRATTRAR